ncbi:hypothetical protein HRE53_17000 [Acaryochloris sp. 'Moss Beach']|uniref:hypothetical protein n=1 Tax=Acaryochloris sp. 'Moss Beach' TaxID=2740837 RepID=UPI001F26F4E7|nr:hypothetical protein [Acaryochloris sp. 'Moss Beach']UJB68259.1 hypothetical protein HRE53_17000 [Acaryochloris sp. 'Moss Beach']
MTCSPVLQLDSEAVLKSIEAQHGLLVERAKGALLKDVGGVLFKKKGRDNDPDPIQKSTMTLPQLEALYPEHGD